MKRNKINLAVVGLGFGNAFVPIYQQHPDVDEVTICDTDSARLERCSISNNVEKHTTDFDAVLNNSEIDAVHLVSGIPDHAKQTLAVLNSGKHCACTVPMAVSIEDLHAIVELQRKTGLKYMMMETQIYGREFLYLREMHSKGAFGHIQFLRGAHYQDMENWPPYWAGLPPMWYATHAISPLLFLSQTSARKVHCIGSGYMRPELQKQYNNPYPIETAIFELASNEIPLSMEVTRALFHSARAYSECFNVYGEDVTFEWQQTWSEKPVIFRLSGLGERNGPRVTTEERIDIPDYADRLPSEIAPFTGIIKDETPQDHPARLHGGGHGGSHPHLVHEFVRSVIENRDPTLDAVKSAQITAAGICAHESAMKNGAEVIIPGFENHD